MTESNKLVKKKWQTCLKYLETTIKKIQTCEKSHKKQQISETKSEKKTN